MGCWLICVIYALHTFMLMPSSRFLCPSSRYISCTGPQLKMVKGSLAHRNALQGSPCNSFKIFLTLNDLLNPYLHLNELCVLFNDIYWQKVLSKWLQQMEYLQSCSLVPSMMDKLWWSLKMWNISVWLVCSGRIWKYYWHCVHIQKAHSKFMRTH